MAVSACTCMGHIIMCMHMYSKAKFRSVILKKSFASLPKPLQSLPDLVNFVGSYLKVAWGVGRGGVGGRAWERGYICPSCKSIA